MLFWYKQLPFGVSSASAIFQRAMDTIPQGLSGVVYYQDDVLVTGLKGLEMVKNPDQPSQILCRVGLPWELVRATGDQVTEVQKVSQKDQDVMSSLGRLVIRTLGSRPGWAAMARGRVLKRHRC